MSFFGRGIDLLEHKAQRVKDPKEVQALLDEVHFAAGNRSLPRDRLRSISIRLKNTLRRLTGAR